MPSEVENCKDWPPKVENPLKIGLGVIFVLTTAEFIEIVECVLSE